MVAGTSTSGSNIDELDKTHSTNSEVARCLQIFTEVIRASGYGMCFVDSSLHKPTHVLEG